MTYPTESPSTADNAYAPLARWLARGQAWLADVRVAGLADPNASLRARGRAWADEAVLLGWTTVAGLVDRSMDLQLAPHERAQAWLDITVWIATAHRLESAAMTFDPNGDEFFVHFSKKPL
ncbi:hypothetical protein CKO35_12220 [Ectothiorhodospira shaposhnikovii]|uniref:hypothetical protein n=1 Tax=Ectothiorhodospira shaposhnikovii TaxID=1054 RepID=UPI0019072F18|nr:hypothetical protein [Ectothiorhodospira shaposhnikovii]MBK1674061.1 hypothetical protein [Ectothiorhodospira shaposhnikovii]